jgi:hypothetical protein
MHETGRALSQPGTRPSEALRVRLRALGTWFTAVVMT